MKRIAVSMSVFDEKVCNVSRSKVQKSRTRLFCEVVSAKIGDAFDKHKYGVKEMVDCLSQCKAMILTIVVGTGDDCEM